MSYSVVTRPFAELDLAEARDFYQQQQEGLEARFLAELAAAIGRITESPNMFPKVFRNVRKAPVRIFPYSVLYVVRQDVVIVVAVYRASRNPTTWQSRLPPS